jgi:hypothetical protein
VKGGSQKIDLQTLNSLFPAIVDSHDVGLYGSIGEFTKDAEDATRKQTNRKITLINVERLSNTLADGRIRIDDGYLLLLPFSAEQDSAARVQCLSS